MNKNILITASPVNDQVVNISIEGELTIRNANQLKAKLSEALTSYQNINLKVRNVNRGDLSVVQLFLSVARTARKLGKKVNVEFEQTEYIVSLMETSGMGKVFLQR